MSRSRLNCTVIELELSELVEVSSVTPAIKANCRSSGVVTLEAMVSALAPGRRRGDLDGGKVDLRQRRDRQHRKGDHADHQQSGRQQRRRDRTADERFGDAHCGAGAAEAPQGTRRGRRGVSRRAQRGRGGRRGDRLDGHAGAELQLAVDHDLIAGGQAGFDQRRGAAGIGRSTP